MRHRFWNRQCFKDWLLTQIEQRGTGWIIPKFRKNPIEINSDKYQEWVLMKENVFTTAFKRKSRDQLRIEIQQMMGGMDKETLQDLWVHIHDQIHHNDN